MSAVEVFQFPETGQAVRSVLIDDEPWFVAADVTAILGYGGGARNAIGRLPDRMKGVEVLNTLGGQQQMTVVSEPGAYRLVMRSNLPQAEQFQDWLAEDVIPALRKTGRYELARLSNPLDELERQTDLTKRAIQIAREEKGRADRAEAQVLELTPAAHNWEVIQGGDGITLRTFHKKYFAVNERAFFEHLYSRGYLIDQRGKGGWSEKRQKHRDGSQHRHPTAKGKAWLYLHASVDRSESRREGPRVKPGDPETDLKQRLIREGLPPHRNAIELAGGAQ